MSLKTKDKFGRGISDLRISLTDRCNLRCTYCMPREVFGPDYAFLKPQEWLQFSELETLVSAFVRLGVRKVRLTGGEPLLRPKLPDFVSSLRRFPEISDLAITTNGLLLAKKAPELKAAGLHRINISLDALDPAICGKLNGLGVLPDAVLAGIDAACSAGLSVRVNMVVERGVNDGEILPMARYFKERGITLRFIEFMDVGNHNQWSLARVMSAGEILRKLETEFPLVPLDLTSSREVAKRYRYADGSAEIGLITSVTEPFCGGCTRARLSADGRLFTCLFATSGVNLKEWLRAHPRTPEVVLGHLHALWGKRSDRYSEERHLRLLANAASPKVEMSYIGG